MTRIMHLTVGPDGRVAVPGAEPGQTVTVEISDTDNEPKRRTLDTARTDEERERIIAEILEAAQRLRQELSDEDIQIALNHGDYLYGEDGLPK